MTDLVKELADMFDANVEGAVWSCVPNHVDAAEVTKKVKEELARRWRGGVVISRGTNVLGPASKPAEAPCRGCGRPNDVGVKVCWSCGGVP